jgi:hypothetical protein
MMHPSDDREFVVELRAAAGAYLSTVDAWEAAYRKYYRVTGPGTKVSADLQSHEAAFKQSRRRLADLAPRARGLCFKHGLKDPWTGLLRSSLGQYAPQDRAVSAISRAERQQVNECLILLAEACAEFKPGVETAEGVAELKAAPARRPWLRRLLDFFY